jgi:hypothetical protein
MTFTSTTIKELRALGLGDEMNDRILEIFERANVKKPKKAAAAVERATRLAENWVLPAEWRELAVGLGLRGAEVDREAMKIKNWSMSSKNGAKLNWKSTWRNWCIGMLEEAGRPVLTPAEAGGGAKSSAGPETFDEKTWAAIAKRVKAGSPIRTCRTSAT